MSDDFIVIRVFNNEIESAMAQQMLEGAGIKSFAFKDDVGGMEPQLQLAGGVRLIVNVADVQRAEEVLASVSEENR